MDVRAETLELLDQRGRAEIGARHLIALFQQNVRERTHARTADTDKMYLMDVLQQLSLLLILRNLQHEIGNLIGRLGAAERTALLCHAAELSFFR